MHMIPGSQKYHILQEVSRDDGQVKETDAPDDDRRLRQIKVFSTLSGDEQIVCPHAESMYDIRLTISLNISFFHEIVRNSPELEDLPSVPLRGHVVEYMPCPTYAEGQPSPKRLLVSELGRCQLRVDTVASKVHNRPNTIPRKVSPYG